MKNKLLKKINLGMTALILTGVAPVYADTITKLTEQGFLGSGFDSSTQTFKAPCVTGRLAYVGSSTGQVGLQSGISQDRLLTELGMAVGADISLDIIKASGAASFSANTANTSNSISAAYLVSAAGKNAVLQDLTLTKVGTQAVQNGNVKQVCGDSFIHSLALEAKLMINVKFSFTSSSLKAQFQSDASANIMDFLKLKGNMNAAVNKYGRNVQFIVSATQVGGDVSKLSNIFKDVNSTQQDFKAGMSTQIFKCDIDNFQACSDAISQMINYATAPGGFASQLNGMTYDPQKSDGPAWIQYGYTNYSMSEAAELSTETTEVGEDIKQKRRSLVRMYLKLSEDLGRTQELIDLSSTESGDKERLQAIQSIVRGNFEVVQRAIQTCRYKQDSCVEAYAQATAELKNYDPRSIVKIMTFEDYCNLNDDQGGIKKTVAAILEVTQISSDMSCAMAYRRLQDVTELNLAGKNLTTLEPLRGLNGLTSINASNNQIYSLDGIEGLNQLEVLNLHHNRIININALKGLGNLISVNLANNSINNLSVLESLKIQTVRVYGNPLSTKWNHDNYAINNRIVTNSKVCGMLREYVVKVRSEGINYSPMYEAMNLAPVFKNAKDPRSSDIEGWYRCDLAVSAIQSEPKEWQSLSN